MFYVYVYVHERYADFVVTLTPAGTASNTSSRSHKGQGKGKAKGTPAAMDVRLTMPADPKNALMYGPRRILYAPSLMPFLRVSPSPVFTPVPPCAAERPTQPVPCPCSGSPFRPLCSAVAVPQHFRPASISYTSSLFLFFPPRQFPLPCVRRQLHSSHSPRLARGDCAHDCLVYPPLCASARHIWPTLAVHTRGSQCHDTHITFGPHFHFTFTWLRRHVMHQHCHQAPTHILPLPCPSAGPGATHAWSTPRRMQDDGVGHARRVHCRHPTARQPRNPPLPILLSLPIYPHISMRSGTLL